MIYYRKRMHRKSSKGKRAHGGSPEVTSILTNLSHLIPSASKSGNTCDMFSTRELTRNSVGIRVLSHSISVCHLPKFQSPRSKAGFLHKTHCLRNSVGSIASHSYQETMETLLESEFPGLMFLVQAGLSEDNSLRPVDFFCIPSIVWYFYVKLSFFKLLRDFSLLIGLRLTRYVNFFLGIVDFFSVTLISNLFRKYLENYCCRILLSEVRLIAPNNSI